MSYCAKIPEENQAAALLHYLGISRTWKGYWYIRWILEWGQQEEMLSLIHISEPTRH